ncbi:MAG: DMT family transporter [Candidatus Hodarchaeales archaeon]|jgi:drug/metabolite transporter (DMT)-like permease
MLNMSFHYKAQTYLIVATIIWGIAPIFLETALDYLTPLRVMTLRFSIAVLILFFLVALTRGLNGFKLLSNKTCIFLGWLDAFGYLAATIGQEMTTAGLATMLATCYIVIVPFYAWKLEGSKPNAMTVILALVAVVGVFFIGFNGDWSNFYSLSIIGIFASIAATLVFGLFVAVSGKFLKESNENGKNIDPLAYLNATTFHIFLPLFLFSMLTERSPVYLPPRVIPELLFLAVFATIISFSLYNWAITRIGSVRTSFYLLLQVIIPFTWELVFWGQYYSYWVYGGIFLILLVLILTSRDNRNLRSDIKNIRITLVKLRTLSALVSFYDLKKSQKSKKSRRTV